ncbi:MAG: hypothetical protein V1769_00575 [Thermoplasmatota archaeon]
MSVDSDVGIMVEEKRHRRSFHDISPREYMYFPKATLEMGRIGQFSTLELYHIFFAMLILTVAFWFALSRNSLMMVLFFGPSLDVDRLISCFAKSFVAIVSAFFCHELFHKLMAQHFRLWSEFRMYPKGLIVSLFFPLRLDLCLLLLVQ